MRRVGNVKGARPDWACTDEMPDARLFDPQECFVAGALSTLPPFSTWHPAWCLPIAERALEAASEWEPDA